MSTNLRPTQHTYPAYKESGIEWLGEIPEHWEAKRLKYVSLVRPSNVDKKTDDNEIPVLLCNYTDVYNNDLITSDITFMGASATAEEIDKFLIAEGDVIVTKDSESPYDIAVPAYVAEDFENTLCGYHLTHIRPVDVYGKYLFRLFQSLQFNAQFVVGANGVTRFGLPQHVINNAFVALPPLPEQRAIARFLDHKTAQIDALIAKKEALLARLADKRTALISHAVTKGLDPHAPMKDLGIAWLGEIPAHWEEIRIKHVVDAIIDTEHKTAPFHEDGEYLVVRTSNIRHGQLVLEGAKYTDHDGFIEWSKRGVPRPGDIIFTREAPAGEACIVPEDIPLCLGQRTVLFRINHESTSPSFLLYSLYAGLANEFIQMLSQGTTVDHFNMSDIGNIPLFKLPYYEQLAIAEFINEHTMQIDEQVSKVRQAIARLKDYRTALITHAVTGKIDVRTVPVPESPHD